MIWTALLGTRSCELDFDFKLQLPGGKLHRNSTCDPSVGYSVGAEEVKNFKEAPFTSYMDSQYCLYGTHFDLMAVLNGRQTMNGCFSAHGNAWIDCCWSRCNILKPHMSN
ncbi:hypothetical protein GBF38_006764, partial [Nibea albiflora]